MRFPAQPGNGGVSVSAVHQTHANITHPDSHTHTLSHTGDVLSALLCGALGALNENMLVEGCIRCLSTRGKKKRRHVDPRSNCGFFLKKLYEFQPSKCLDWPFPHQF